MELSAKPARKRRGNIRVVANLTLANTIATAAGLVTGPIVARALGVSGRGELAAIVAVLTAAPLVLDLGVPAWLARERARGGSRAELIGAALPLAVLGSLIGIAAAVPLSDAIGNDRAVVETFLQIGLFLSPIVVVPAMLVGLALGDSRWGLLSATTIMTSLLPLVFILALTLAGRLTVATAAVAYLVGGVAATLILLGLLKGMRRLVFSVQRTRAAVAFGSKSWMFAIAGSANQRLDQILMAALVSSSELGLYAVAVTSTSLTFGLIAAASNATFPQVAAGDNRLAARSCRLTLCVVAAGAVAVALAAPWLIPFIFGAPFADAVPMVTILLAASIPMAAAIMLGSALTAIGDPGAALRAELIGLAVTIPALVVFLPDHGGRAAAVISLVAYSLRLAVQLRTAQRRFDVRWWEFIVPAREDAVWLAQAVRRVLAARRK